MASFLTASAICCDVGRRCQAAAQRTYPPSAGRHAGTSGVGGAWVDSNPPPCGSEGLQNYYLEKEVQQSLYRVNVVLHQSDNVETLGGWYKILQQERPWIRVSCSKTKMGKIQRVSA